MFSDHYQEEIQPLLEREDIKAALDRLFKLNFGYQDYYHEISYYGFNKENQLTAGKLSSAIDDLNHLAENLPGLSFDFDNIDQTGFEQITKITSAEILTIHGDEITNLTPIQNMENLESLTVSDITLLDVNALIPLQKLNSVNFYDLRLSNTDAFSTMKNLKTVSLSSVGYIDANSFKSSNSIEKIALRKVMIESPQVFGEIGSLNEFILSNVKTKNFKFLEKLNQVKKLTLNNLPGLAEFDFFTALTELEMLTLSSLQINDAKSLTPLQNLKYLFIDFTAISDAEPLAMMTKLEQIHISQTLITQIEPLKDLPNLVRLTVRETDIIDEATFDDHPRVDLNDKKLMQQHQKNRPNSVRPKYVEHFPLPDDPDNQFGINLILSDGDAVVKPEEYFFNDHDLERSIDQINSFLNEYPDLVLDLTASMVSDTKPLAKLKNLKRLNLARTPIYDISPLVNLPKLEALNISPRDNRDFFKPPSKKNEGQGTIVIQADIDPSRFENQEEEENYWAKTRQMQMNPITPILDESGATTSFRTLRGLTDLTAEEHRKVIDFSPLSKMKELKILNLASTDIADLSVLEKLKNLEKLDLSQTYITDLTPLALLKKLEYLDIGGTDIRNIGPLKSVSTLKTLKVSGTKLSDVSALVANKKLKHLDLTGSFVFDHSMLTDILKNGLEVRPNIHPDR